MKKKKKKPLVEKNRQYFTIKHQNAIVEYNNSSDPIRRNELYVTLIQPAFKEIIKKIVYRYKFHSLPNVQLLMDECESHLASIIGKFDESKNHKAFSYFSVITKNWLTHKSKSFMVQNKKEVLCENISKEMEITNFSSENTFIQDEIYEEFKAALWKEIERWETVLVLEPAEEKVLKAIKMLLSHPDSIEIFNKKAIFLYVRELTGLNTKQVVTNLNKFRELYRHFRVRWNSED